MAEFTASQSDYPKFQALETEILGVSANVPQSQAIFAQMLKLEFPLLSDFRMDAIRKYGVKNPKRDLAVRSWFIIDKKGIVRFKHVEPQPGRLLPNEALLKELRAIEGKKG